MDDSDVLRLEVSRFRDPAHWDWVLKDAHDALVTTPHRVSLDPESPEYKAMTRLQFHVRWKADRMRPFESQAEILEQVGHWMGEKVFGKVGTELVRRSPATALVVVPPEAGVLRHLPFELAWVGGEPLALQDVSLVYDVDGDESSRRDKRLIDKRVRMLAVFSLPKREPLLMLSQQRYELVRSIERIATSRGKSVNLVTLQYGVTQERLRGILEEGEGWDVIHFSGHGLATELRLERAGGETDPVPTHKLLRMLKPARSRLKLLVLASCDSGAAAANDARLISASPAGNADEETGDGAPLPDLAVDAARELDCAVLGMRYRVSDDFSIQLAHHLYDSLLAKGNFLPRALQLALPKALEHWPEPGKPALSVATPALFGARAIDLPLVPPPQPKPDFRPGGKMSYFGRQPEFFVGRVEPMAAASRALAADDRFSGVLFHGPESAGKTACAVELAFLYKDQFEGLVRHPAPARGETIAGSLTRLAQTLETQLEDFGSEMKEAVLSKTKLEGFLPRLTELIELHAVFILIDGIETLLTSEGEWQDDLWRLVVDALLNHDRGSRLLLTSRLPLTPPHDRLCVVPVPALSPEEALLLARQLPNLGDVFRGRTGLSMDRAAPLLADTLAAAGGMPVLIREADKKLTSPSVLGDLPAYIAKGRSDVEATGKREEYLRLVRRWTRGIDRPSNGAVPPGESAVDVT